VPPANYVHPEFGYLCPTSRLRRDLRMAIVAIVLGGIIGATVVTLRADHDRHAETERIRIDAVKADAAEHVTDSAKTGGAKGDTAKPPCEDNIWADLDGNCATSKPRRRVRHRRLRPRTRPRHRQPRSRPLLRLRSRRRSRAARAAPAMTVPCVTSVRMAAAMPAMPMRPADTTKAPIKGSSAGSGDTARNQPSGHTIRCYQLQFPRAASSRSTPQAKS
jgi:hypothetical protein